MSSILIYDLKLESEAEKFVLYSFFASAEILLEKMKAAICFSETKSKRLTEIY